MMLDNWASPRELHTALDPEPVDGPTVPRDSPCRVAAIMSDGASPRWPPT